MTNEETCQIFAKLARLYPNDKTFTRTKEEVTGTIVLWQEALADVTLDCATRFLKIMFAGASICQRFAISTSSTSKN